MRTASRLVVAALAAVVGLVPAVASAQPGPPPWPPRNGPPPGGPGFRPGPGGPGPGMHRPPPGGPGWRDDGWDPGAAAAAGIVGLAIGAIVAGSAQRGAVVYDDDHVERCLRRYRSYDPSSDTYRGYDGRLHRCRL